MKKIVLVLIIGLLMFGCGKANPPVQPFDYDNSKTIAPMKDGKLHGMRKAYRGNGTIILLTPYKKGKKDGTEKRYNRYGKLTSEISYKEGQRDGLSKEWNFSGKELERYSITPYKNDKKNGLEINYYANGKISSKIPYHNAKIDGLFESWQKDGTPRRIIPYKKDKRDGLVKYFEDGQLTYIGSFKDGKQYGIHKSYNRNGVIQEAVPYVKGKLHGVGKIYDEDGSLKYTLAWSNGVEGKIVYSEKEKQKQKRDKKARVERKAKKGSLNLQCSSENSFPSMSEISRKKAIARGKGEGAALGYQMKHNSISTSRFEANNFCTQNVNIEALPCIYAQVYLAGCMRKFGY